MLGNAKKGLIECQKDTLRLSTLAPSEGVGFRQDTAKIPEKFQEHFLAKLHQSFREVVARS